jgi:hypothetical protein
MAGKKEELIKEDKGWTRALPDAELRQATSWEDIEAFHSGFSCVGNAQKYLEIPIALILFFPKPQTPHKMVYKVL